MTSILVENILNFMINTKIINYFNSKNILLYNGKKFTERRLYRIFNKIFK